MRTVDPDLWFRNFRRSSPDTWALESTDSYFPTRLRHGLEDAFREFQLHCSARGLNLVALRCATKCGRSLRTVLLVTMSIMIAVSLVLYFERESQLRPPLEVKLQSWQHPTSSVPFPAVAICSNNLVSKKKLEKLTLSLSRRLGNYSVEAIKHHLLHFAELVMMAVPETEIDYELTQLILDHVTEKSNVTDIMYQLSPKCSTFLRNCAWRGLTVECWKLFARRLTSLGYCCVVNGRYQPEDINRPPMILEQIGQSSGLVVVATQNDEDNAYLRRPTNTGMEVLIFDGTEYPLLESGVARLYPVRLNFSMFFSVSVKTQNTSPDLEDTSETWRGCRFRDLNGPRNVHSSYGWCLTDCRQWCINCVCNCVPYMLFPTAKHVVCRPHHLTCLNKYKGKKLYIVVTVFLSCNSFKYYYPGNITDAGLNEEITMAQDCQHCRQDCARTVYNAEVFHVAYRFIDKLFLGIGSQSIWSSSNTSVMHFFYSSKSHELYLVEPNVRWYEDAAAASCLWMFFANMTIITAAELIFYLTVRWCHHFLRRGTRLQTTSESVDDSDCYVLQEEYK